jgi:hypothetical protein
VKIAGAGVGVVISTSPVGAGLARPIARERRSAYAIVKAPFVSIYLDPEGESNKEMHKNCNRTNTRPNNKIISMANNFSQNFFFLCPLAPFCKSSQTFFLDNRHREKIRALLEAALLQ